MSVIELNDVSVTFHEGGRTVEAVKHVNISVEKGEIFGIVGFSGAGKSTLVRTINLLERPTGGHVIIDGNDITALKGGQLSDLRKNIGFIFQGFNLITNVTVGKNIEFALKAGGYPKAQWPERVRELLALVGLENKIDSYPSSLSGGQKQRVSIARALANKPEILLCDEATSALDLETTEGILALLQRINRELGITIVFITHQLDVAKQIFDRVAVMENGVVVEQGNTFDVFSAPKHPTTYAAHNYVFKNHILPGLGDVLLSELTSEMVGDFLEERRRFGNHRPGSSGLGGETMRHIHRLLQQCLDQAMRDGLIGDNPARAFHYSKPKKVNADVLTPLEMEDYLDAAERLGHLPMFMLALTVGLRQGELIALKWNDLKVKDRTLTISEQRSVERRELIEYGSETRTITLASEVVDLLIMEHIKHPNSPLMFMHPATQRPYSPQMVRRMHNEIIEEAGLDHIRFTDLRHTCAVLSLRNGMEAKELARMLGHYRPSITRQNYEPYLPHKAQNEDLPNEATQDELQQAANILDNLLKF